MGEPQVGRFLISGTQSPPPPPSPPGPLSYQGSIATGHTYGATEGARKIFFIPLAHLAPLPTRALEHPNTILEPNLDSNTHPNPQPALTPHLTRPLKPQTPPPTFPPKGGLQPTSTRGGGRVQKRGGGPRLGGAFARSAKLLTHWKYRAPIFKRFQRSMKLLE